MGALLANIANAGVIENRFPATARMGFPADFPEGQ
jgi:hypothetical protein